MSPSEVSGHRERGERHFIVFRVIYLSSGSLEELYNERDKWEQGTGKACFCFHSTVRTSIYQAPGMLGTAIGAFCTGQPVISIVSKLKED